MWLSPADELELIDPNQKEAGNIFALKQNNYIKPGEFEISSNNVDDSGISDIAVGRDGSSGDNIISTKGSTYCIDNETTAVPAADKEIERNIIEIDKVSEDTSEEYDDAVVPNVDQDYITAQELIFKLYSIFNYHYFSLHSLNRFFSEI